MMTTSVSIVREPSRKPSHQNCQPCTARTCLMPSTHQAWALELKKAIKTKQVINSRPGLRPAWNIIKGLLRCQGLLSGHHQASCWDLRSNTITNIIENIPPEVHHQTVDVISLNISAAFRTAPTQDGIYVQPPPELYRDQPHLLWDWRRHYMDCGHHPNSGLTIFVASLYHQPSISNRSTQTDVCTSVPRWPSSSMWTTSWSSVSPYHARIWSTRSMASLSSSMWASLVFVRTSNSWVSIGQATWQLHLHQPPAGLLHQHAQAMQPSSWQCRAPQHNLCRHTSSHQKIIYLLNNIDNASRRWSTHLGITHQTRSSVCSQNPHSSFSSPFIVGPQEPEAPLEIHQRQPASRLVLGKDLHCYSGQPLDQPHPLDIKCFTDSDWAGDQEGGRSTSGSVISIWTHHCLSLQRHKAASLNRHQRLSFMLWRQELQRLSSSDSCWKRSKSTLASRPSSSLTSTLSLEDHCLASLSWLIAQLQHLLCRRWASIVDLGTSSLDWWLQDHHLESSKPKECFSGESCTHLHQKCASIYSV